MLYRTTGERGLARLAREARCARPGGSLRSPGRLAALAREARCARPGGSLRSPGRLAALARKARCARPRGGSLRSPGRLRRPAPPSAWPAGAAAPAPHGAGPGPRPRYGGPPAQLPRLRRGFRGVLGLGPPRLRWAAAGLARRPCLRLGLAPGGAPGPCGAAGPARAPSAPLGSLRGALRPIGGPPAPVGAGRLPPRRGPLRRPRSRRSAASPRRPLRSPARGSWPGGSCRLPPPVGAAALLPPPGLRPLLAAPGPPLPPPVGRPGYRHGPPRLLPPGGGWGGCAAPFRRRRPPEWGLSGLRPAVKGCASGPSGPPLTAGRWPDLC